MSTTQTTSTAGPVTVSITRHLPPQQSAQMVAWVTAGQSLAQRFEGFLGTGWVRPSVTSEEWHMLYRFADPEALARWEASPERRWWLDSAQGLVAERTVERRTGIEGWFDEPSTRDVEHVAPPAPPRWKQACVIWLAFFPLSLLLGTLLAASGLVLGVVLRTLVTTLVATPLMTYVLLPWMTRRFEGWLRRGL